MDPHGKTIIRPTQGQALNRKYTKKTIKHGGGLLLLWLCSGVRFHGMASGQFFA